MNPELRSLLEDVGLPGASEPDLWRRTVMLRNFGGVPLAPGETPDLAGSGFLLLFLDSHGRPDHYAKCRPLLDRGFERECRVLEHIKEEPALQERVLGVRAGRSTHLRVHISRHISGPRYDSIVPGQRHSGWRRTMDEILETSATVCRGAGALVPGLCPDGAPDEQVPLFREAEWRVSRLAEGGLDSRMLDRLLRVLDGIQLPREIQHGDLWPGNVFSTDGRAPWRLIDFERIGEIQVPLFDLLHMTWASSQLLSLGDRGPWLPVRGTGVEGPWKDAARSLIRDAAERAGLTETQIGGALVFTLIEMTTFRRRTGMPASFSRSLIEDLRTMDRLLVSGRSLADLVEPVGPGAMA